MTIRFFLAVLFVLAISSLHAQQYLKDFSSISEITYAGSKVFFSATAPSGGMGLWVTDGTPEGTRMVKDLDLENYNFSPQYLTAFQDELFFSAMSPQHGVELWKSDGTPEGTQMVKDINPNNAGYYPNSSPRHLLVFKNQLYFEAAENGDSRTLFKTDGTADGIVPVYGSGIGEIEIAGEYLYFTSGGANLHRSDGTPGAHLTIHVDNNYHTESLTFAEGSLFFITYSFYYDDIKLYVIPEPGNDPVLLKEFNAPIYGRQEIGNFCAVENQLFFSFRTYYDGEDPTDELWASDGTVEGTRLVRSFPWSPHWSGSEMSNFIAYDGQLYFKNGSSEKHSFWKSDGTEGGTQKVSDVVITAPNYETNPPVISGGKLFFSGDSELWVSDGTSGGTNLFANIDQSGESLPRRLADANGVLYFAADDGSGMALWNNLSACEIAVTSGYGNVANNGSLYFNEILPNDCAKKTISISNPGNKELFVSRVSVTGADFYVQGELPNVIKPGETVDLNLYFAPVTAGEKAGTLTIISNDENESYYLIRISGTAISGENQGFCDSYISKDLVKSIVPASTDTDIQISNNRVAEKLPIGTVVGNLSVPNSTESHSYTLVAGEGDNDNHNFSIEGNVVKTRTVFDFQHKALYSLRIRAEGTGSIENYLVIHISDSPETTSGDCEPTSIRLSGGYNDLAFNSDGDLFVVGDEGRILRSKDKGVSWEELNSGVNARLHRIFFKGGSGFITTSWSNILLRSDDNGQTWFQLYFPTSDDFYSYKLHFLDENRGFIVGTDGKVLHTSDGGRSWVKKNTGYLGDFRDVWFWDENSGIAITDFTEMIRTSDGGATWTEVDTDYLGYYKNFKKLWFFDNENGFVMSSSYLYKTTDGGNSWTKINSIYGDHLLDIRFADEKEGYVFGGWSGSDLFKTNDGGESWETMGFYEVRSVSGIAVEPASGTLFLVGNTSGLGSSTEPGHVIASTTSGASWNFLSEFRTQKFYSLSFPTENTGYVFGEYDAFKTVNKGMSWTDIDLGKKIFDAHFFDEDHGLLLDGDSVYRTTDGGKSFTALFGKDPHNGPGFWRIHAVNTNLIFIYGWGIVYRTENGGTDWVSVSEENSIPEIFFPTEETGYLLRLFGEIVKTVDGGKTWDLIYESDTESSLAFSALYFIDELTGFKGGEKGTLHKTTDGGLSWTPIFTGLNTTIRRLFFENENEGYIMTESGSGASVYKTADGGYTWNRLAYSSDRLSDFELRGENLFFGGDYGYFCRLSPGVKPTQPSYIAGEATVCEGSIIDYKVADYFSGSYHWSVAGADLHSVRSQATVHFPAPGTFELQVSQTNGCGTSEVRKLPITVSELEAPVIEGPASVGLGQQNVLYALQVPKEEIDVSWKVENAMGITDNGTEITVDWPEIRSTGKVSVIETDFQSGCRAKAFLEVSVSSLILAIEEGDPMQLVVYPNPTKGQLKIQSEAQADLNVRIYDATGREYLRTNVPHLSTREFNIQSLPSGVLFIEIEDKKGKYHAIKRIIKL